MSDLTEALRACLGAMHMQVMRETEQFHIPQPTAKVIWNEAVDKGYKALVDAGDLDPADKSFLTAKV